MSELHAEAVNLTRTIRSSGVCPPGIETVVYPVSATMVFEGRRLNGAAAGYCVGRSDKRQTEFATGRWAGRLAMCRVLDVQCGCEIGVHRDGRALWPHDVVGSIAHSNGIAVAAVGCSAQYKAVGIDYELRGRPSLAAIRVVCDDEELKRCDYKSDDARTLIFAAKEAAFKALNPSIQAGVCLTHLRVLQDADDAASFVVLVRGGEPDDVMRGRAVISGDRVFAAVAIRAARRQTA